MRLPMRDLIATVLVAVAGQVYVAWYMGSAAPGLGSARAAGSIVLALGFAASATAVVPSAGQLLHGSRLYLVGTSLIGVAALVGGLMTLIRASGIGFALMTGTMVVLWLISTVHHNLPADVRTPHEGAGHTWHVVHIPRR